LRSGESERSSKALVAKKKDGKYNSRTTTWYKVINPTYSQKAGPAGFFPEKLIEQPIKT
jgi:ATP-dependent DNA ligase